MLGNDYTKSIYLNPQICNTTSRLLENNWDNSTRLAFYNIYCNLLHYIFSFLWIWSIIVMLCNIDSYANYAKSVWNNTFRHASLFTH